MAEEAVVAEPYAQRQEAPGGRPVVLLLHGMLSGSAQWAPLIAEAGDDVRFIPVDLPGYGAAPGPEDGEYTLDRLVDLLAPVIETEHPRFVVGHSMGAIIALAVAARWPQQFERAGLIGLPVYGDCRDDPTVFDGTAIKGRLRFYRHPRSHVGCQVLHRTAPAWSALTPLVRRGRPLDVLRTLFDHSHDAHYGSLQQVVFAGLVPQLASHVTTPVAALQGDRDRAAPLAPVQELAMQFGWRLRLVRNGGHQTVLHRPAIIARWLRQDVLSR